MNGNMIKVLNDNNEEIDAQVLLYFTLNKTNENYVLYTFGEVDGQKMETIHASIIRPDGEGYIIEAMPDEDWDMVKEIMRKIIRNEEE